MVLKIASGVEFIPECQNSSITLLRTLQPNPASSVWPRETNLLFKKIDNNDNKKNMCAPGHTPRSKLQALPL